MSSNEKDFFCFMQKKYSSFLESLTTISKNGDFSFIEMEGNFIHMDKIPMLLDSGDTEQNCFSVDTIIHCDQTNCIYLVEFKDGWPQNESARELRFKCYETMSKLIRNWSDNNRDRKDFFNLKMKYVVITRPPRKNVQEDGAVNKSFLQVLNNSKGFFKLGILKNTFVDDVRVFVQDEVIFRFLSRVTKTNTMIYHHKGMPTKTVWTRDEASGAINHAECS